MEGISIPQPFCQSFIPFALLVDKVLDLIPGINKVNIDSEGLKKKFGLFGEPLCLGVLIGFILGALAYGGVLTEQLTRWGELEGRQAFFAALAKILGAGIKLGAVMELIPRITSLFIEGLKPISDATRELIAKKFKNAEGLSIGMSPALVIGHPTTLVVSVLLIPVILIIAVILPGNTFLPIASLAVMFYLFPLVLPICKGNVVKAFITGLIALIVGLYFVTNLAPFFTEAAHDVFAATGDKAVRIPEGNDAGALDFASGIYCWITFHLTHTIKLVGPALLVLIAAGMMFINRKQITQKA